MKDYSVVYDGGGTLDDENCCPERTQIGDTTKKPFRGMAWVNSAVKIGDVTDGTSNTLFVIEKRRFDHDLATSQNGH